VENAVVYTTHIHIQKGPLQKVNKYYSTFVIKKVRTLQALKNVLFFFLKPR